MNKVTSHTSVRTSVLRLARPFGSLLAALLLALSAASAGAQQLLTEIDRPLPKFALESVGADNESWQVDKLAGKPWVINFWATWCPPCIEEIPSMNAAWEKLEPEGIGMLAINAGEGRAAVENFLDKIPIDFPSLLGDSNTLPNWSVRALPTTIVVNANGVVVYQALGPREWDDDELLERIINLL